LIVTAAGLGCAFGLPAVRAALSAYLGLTAAPAYQMPISAVTLAAVTPAAPTETPAPNTTLPATRLPLTATAAPEADPTAGPTAVVPIVEQPAAVSQLSEQAGWKILSPGYLPAGYHFGSAYLDTNHQMVALTYLVTRPLPGAADPGLTASKAITVLQALRNDFIPLQVAPAAEVLDVSVAGRPAAFVVGAWDTQFVKDENDPQGGKMVSTWSNELPVKNLYWQIGRVYLVLVTDDDLVSKQQLILMAARTGQSR
jgi:hypothetical protein